jgi:hypothetical protein
MSKVPKVADLRRNLIIRIVVNKNEKAVITRRAKQAGYSTSAFARWLALCGYWPDLMRPRGVKK